LVQKLWLDSKGILYKDGEFTKKVLNGKELDLTTRRLK